MWSAKLRAPHATSQLGFHAPANTFAMDGASENGNINLTGSAQATLDHADLLAAMGAGLSCRRIKDLLLRFSAATFRVRRFA